MGPDLLLLMTLAGVKTNLAISGRLKGSLYSDVLLISKLITRNFRLTTKYSKIHMKTIIH